MKKDIKTSEELAREIAETYRKPFVGLKGRLLQGDVFYDTIYAKVKRVKGASFQEVCRLLEKDGFWVHS